MTHAHAAQVSNTKNAAANNYDINYLKEVTYIVTV